MNEKDLFLFNFILNTDIGATKFFKLLEKFGNVENITKSNKKDLMSISGIGSILAEKILKSLSLDKALKETELAKKHNIKIILYNSPLYPKPLESLPDKPLFLYIKGNIRESDYDSISIVGSRKVSNYGKSVTLEFASYFAKLGITIISGLARGVDTLAHSCAIENNSRTIAVLGNGLLINYPFENKKLQEEISQNGALISEFPLTQKPDKITFPRRNRIVAGLSRATLVTEASAKSGALITARICADYGKDVFVVPGNIYSEVSKGTNKLIQNGAHVALIPNDLASSLGITLKSDKINQQNLKGLELEVVNLIENNENGVPLDLIANKLNRNILDISYVLLKLELIGLIKTAPGQIYFRVY
ncbi:MAG: DNA-processing protein DprA [Endomicrobium sp.]|jgi:DNA processing protein|uniref:DNA-processing protein DprA n=1 Tax=Candidatus Endomicrobiellum cubanum TaxID=3242325 RepID=UPI002825166B|nr:DNA-processing protein DprA [Endomicrobium sp.]MDR2395549.1 DNA-processing protein DprA [Endomicrobium sp.]